MCLLTFFEAVGLLRDAFESLSPPGSWFCSGSDTQPASPALLRPWPCSSAHPSTSLTCPSPNVQVEVDVEVEVEVEVV